MKNAVPELTKKELADVPGVKAALDRSGVVIVPAYIDDATTSKLIGEFQLALGHAGNEFIIPMAYSEGAGRKIAANRIDRKVLPETAAFFEAPWMTKLSKLYLGGEVVLNHDIYFVKDVVGSKHIANDLHFDVSRAFKFFIYLRDTTAENGAFACVPGSHLATREIRKKYGDQINFENRELTRNLPFTEKDAVPVEGKAGSLIIFDTDVFHRAGTVSAGERWVMRGHTRLVSEYSRYNEMEAAPPKSLFSKIKSWFHVA